MDPLLLRVYQQQVLYQCEFLLLAARDINAGLQARQVTRVFYGVQNFLNAAANIAKALWGQGGRWAAERQDLRASLGIAEDSPLRSVTMRNNFEHFDDRLETWWRDSKHHNYVDLNIGSTSRVTVTDPVDRFRLFDPVTTDLYFWSQAFNLQALTNEVQRILPPLRGAVNTPHSGREPASPGEEANGSLPDGARGG
jgi:hypothetical protein